MSTITEIQPQSKSHPLWKQLRACFAHPQNHGWCCIAILLGLAAVLFFHGLSIGELWRTENLRAMIAAEMLRTGNWVVPSLLGEPLFTKPPGMYVAIALCSLPVGGVTEWTARLPSALAATATMLLFYWYVGRQLGRLGGLVAAIILPLSPMWLEKGTAAEIDMMQVFWTTAAILFFLRATEEEKGWRWWLLSFLCVAGGVLTKWTTPAFLYLTAIPFLWWRGQLRLLWSRQHLVSLALASAICLGWAGAAISSGGWHDFSATIAREAMDRFVPNHVPEPYPWWESLLHPLAIFVITLPFSPFALMTLRRGFFQLWDEKGQRLLLALHCWVWPCLLFWCLPREHTPRHSFPLFPGIAGLAAMVFLSWMKEKSSAQSRRGRRGGFSFSYFSASLRDTFFLHPFRWIRNRPRQFLVGMLVLWIGLKLAYVNIVFPKRANAGERRVKGQILSDLVPLNCILYIFKLKDSGITFYYGRLVARLSSPAQLPLEQGAMYCIVCPHELPNWPANQRVEILRRMTDSQGDPILLVKVTQK